MQLQMETKNKSSKRMSRMQIKKMEKEERQQELENPPWVKKILSLVKKKEKSQRRTSQSQANETRRIGY